MPVGVRACLLALYALTVFESSDARLLSAQLLSRHGTRAPNPVVEILCPNDRANLARYHDMAISLAGVTGNGMHELLSMGQATRLHYDNFLQPHFDNAESYVQGVAEDRTLQSAIAFGQGLFPPGSTPGYVATLPVPLPVYSLPDGKDNLLEARKGACKKRLKVDSAKWDQEAGTVLWSQNESLLDKLGSLCGVNLHEVIKGSGDNYGDAIKDITDALMFDYQESFVPIPGLTLTDFEAFRKLAVTQLLGRIVGTPEQRTYMNGQLPDTLLSNFRAAVNGGVKFYAYHGHREMLYSFASFIGLEFNIPFPGLPVGAIPPATTLFIELHQQDTVDQTISLKDAAQDIEAVLTQQGFKIQAAKGIAGNIVNEETQKHQTNLFIRTLLWTPCYQNSSVADGAYILGDLSDGAHCPPVPVKLAGCGDVVDCPFDQYVSIITNQISKTGDWATLCEFKETTHLAEELSAANLNQEHLHYAVSLFSIGFCITFIAAVTLGAVLICMKRSKVNKLVVPVNHQYESDGNVESGRHLSERSGLLDNWTPSNRSNSFHGEYQSGEALP